jgi:hypothetical protein
VAFVCLAWLGACTASTPGARREDGAAGAQSAAGASGAADADVSGAAGDGPRDVLDAAEPNDAVDANTHEVPAPDATEERDADVPSACAGLFCEDFESGALDPAKWGVTAGLDHVEVAAPDVVQSDRAAHGKFAAHFHGKGDAPNDNVFLSTKALPAALLTHNFGRAYVYITPKPTSGHMAMIVAGTAVYGANPKLRDFEVANINGGWQLGFDSLGMTPGGEEVSYPPGQMPYGQWSCVEWELNDAPDMITLWFEGKELGTFDDQHINYPSGHTPGAPIFDGKSTGLVGGFSTYGFGFYDWHPHADFDLYYDDIVLDTKRVGCF